MPRLPRLTAIDAEAALLKAGFLWLRSKGSQRVIYRIRHEDVQVLTVHHGARLLDTAEIQRGA